MKRPQIVFLLGAGFSKNFGLPLTDELTERIFAKFNNGVSAQLVCCMRRYLEGIAVGHKPNYEEIYEAFETITTAANWEYDSVAGRLMKGDWIKFATPTLDANEFTGHGADRPNESLISE